MVDHSVFVDLIEVGTMYLFIGVLVLAYDGQFRSQLTYLKLRHFRYSFVLKIAIVALWPLRETLKNLLHRVIKKTKGDE